MKLTIFTPTYNRAYVLPKLYESLCNQTNQDFVWLIVDDGSTDHTDHIVHGWMAQSKIKIEYHLQKNAGKHIAHNTGVQKCNTELFFCVDSDDYLLHHAVADIMDEYEKIGANQIAGIVSVRLQSKKLVALNTPMPQNIQHASLSDLYECHHFKGDTALVFKTQILRQFYFPHIEGERFVGEEYIYCQIDKEYKLLVSQKKYYVCEYLDDGYTNNMAQLIAHNPRGYMMLKQMKLQVTSRFIISVKTAALYVVGCWLCGEKNILKESPKKILTLLSMPLAVAVYWKRFNKFR